MKHPALDWVANELDNARATFPPFASPHEGFAILKEELDELWDEIKKQHNDRSIERMQNEAIQVAAMAVRFVIDLCDAPTPTAMDRHKPKEVWERMARGESLGDLPVGDAFLGLAYGMELLA